MTSSANAKRVNNNSTRFACVLDQECCGAVELWSCGAVERLSRLGVSGYSAVPPNPHDQAHRHCRSANDKCDAEWQCFQLSVGQPRTVRCTVSCAGTTNNERPTTTTYDHCMQSSATAPATFCGAHLTLATTHTYRRIVVHSTSRHLPPLPPLLLRPHRSRPPCRSLNA